MRKRVSREVRKIVVLIVVLLLFVVAIWAVKQMGDVLGWLLENWQPFIVGFVVAAVGSSITDTIFTKNE